MSSAASSILVTGASGFVGRHLCEFLVNRGYLVSAAVRSKDKGTGLPSSVVCFSVGDISGETDWSLALSGIDVVVHLVSPNNIVESQGDALDQYRKVNLEGTLNLVRQAAATSVRRVVYLSTVKVNGERSSAPLSILDKPTPEGPYGISKLEAEEGLSALCVGTNLDFVILRPPLVYGSGVSGNFSALVKLVTRRLPLPFGLVTGNRRSMVSVRNLTDLIEHCLNHAAASNETFFVSDDHDLSTLDLVLLIAKCTGTKALLLPVPVWFIRFLGFVLFKAAMVERLVGSLQVDIRYTKDMLGWYPPQTPEEGIRETVREQGEVTGDDSHS